ncbi:hypothetical protein KL86DES1_21785 [uncultured Desulfovibrio sp.]|uniref:Uncharacterized protein n=1 Tax=uncultured Desulfovibrio sp. TaxID=167968 RepID=A0A212L9K1_9BACT|nr:hypothetical protein KL86DES1_21785 [uncultured Desulfovibrio sp.]VZH34685.1 conserved protein of unknown function [Desulfovibrio sp. 86]
MLSKVSCINIHFAIPYCRKTLSRPRGQCMSIKYSIYILEIKYTQCIFYIILYTKLQTKI